MLKSKILKLMGAIGIIATTTLGQITQVDLLSQGRAWTNHPGPGTTVTSNLAGGVLTINYSLPADNDATLTWHWASVMNSQDADYRNLTSVEITYTSPHGIVLQLTDNELMTGDGIDLGGMAFEIELPAAPQGATRTINIIDFAQPEWMQGIKPAEVREFWTRSLRSRLPHISGLTITFGRHGAVAASGTAAISKLVLNSSRIASAQSGLDFAGGRFWWEVGSCERSSGSMDIQEGKIDFVFNIADNIQGVLPDFSDWEWSWVNAFAVGGEWSNFENFEITYTSNRPLEIHFWDHDYIAAGVYDSYFHTLPAAPTGRTIVLSVRDFNIAFWVPQDSPVRQTPLRERLAGNHISGIFIAPDQNTKGVTTTGTITRFAANGVLSGIVDGDVLPKIPDNARNLADEIWEWGIIEDEQGSKVSSFERNQNGIELVLDVSQAGWNAGYAGIKSASGGDWSRFEGFQITYNSDKPLYVALTDPAIEFPFHVTLPATFGRTETLGFLLPSFKQLRTTPHKDRRNLNDVNIVAIEVAGNIQGRTNVKIEEFIVLGLEDQEISVIWGGQNTFEFNGGTQAPTASATLRNGFPLEIVVEGGASSVGTHTARAKLATPNPAYTLIGVLEKQFTITQASISPILRIQNATVNSAENLVFSIVGNGNGTPIYEFSSNGTTFNTTRPTSVGRHFVRAVIPATANFLGATTPPVEFAIVEQNARTAQVEWGAVTEFTFDGTMKAPTAVAVSPVNGRRVPLLVTGAINAGTHTATAMLETPDPDFILTNTTREFTIKGKGLSQNMITPIRGFPFTGTRIMPPVEVRDGDIFLRQGLDYTVSYGENINIGTGSVTITGIGNYSGSASRDFTIVPNGGRLIFATVNWEAQTSFEFNGTTQAPFATTAVDIMDGTEHEVIVLGGQRNAGSHFAVAQPNSPFVLLTNPIIPYTITPKELEVSWSEPREFYFNRMLQVPEASVNAPENVDLRVIGGGSSIRKYEDALRPFAQIVSANAGNFILTENYVEYEIKPRRLEVVLPPVFENTPEDEPVSLANENFTTQDQLEKYILSQIGGIDGFQTDTTGLVDRGDSEATVLKGAPRVRVVRENSNNAPPLRSMRSAEQVFLYRVIIDFDGELTNNNYALPTREIVVSVGQPLVDGPISIHDKERGSRYGIRFAQNPVSDIAEISVILPNNERAVETKIVIYDMTGNVVFASTASTGSATNWDLRNSAGRFVANGTYLVIAEVKDRNRRVYTYSARLGVRR